MIFPVKVTVSPASADFRRSAISMAFSGALVRRSSSRGPDSLLFSVVSFFSEHEANKKLRAMVGIMVDFMVFGLVRSKSFGEGR